jgi:thiol-disulfide isomerase/thioredoxin
MNSINTIEEFNNIINTPGKHVIKVSADWCGPCKVLKSTIDQMPSEVQKLFVEVNANDADTNLLILLNVRNIPCMIFYDGNREFNRTIGLKTTDEILSIINEG